MKSFILLAGALALAGCQAAETPQRKVAQPKQPADDGTLAFPAVPDKGPPAALPPALHAQVVLDRLGFSPGVIDGKEGESFTLAVKGFQTAHDLDPSGELDQETLAALAPWDKLPATLLVRIPAAFARGPFTPGLPKNADAQAKLPALGYRGIMEALAERFHTTPETLIALNGAQTPVGTGAVIRVPNIPNIDVRTLGTDERGWNATLQTLAVSPKQPEVAKVVVRKSQGVLMAFDADDRLIAQFPATMGSAHDPLPIGHWKIQGISRNPDFHYNPQLFWDASDSAHAAVLKPGPNGPVGVVWIDLSKPHYGIHGTSEPQTIGRAESHGCIRLTNWDAARLAQMVKAGVPAIFEE